MTIPFLGRARKVRPTLDDLKVLLSVNDSDLPPAIDTLDEETKSQLTQLPTGSVALIYQGKNEGN